MVENKEKKDGTRDGLALIIGGLFILGLVFATYTYFNRGGNVDGDNPQGQSALERLRGIISSNTERDDEDDDEDVEVDVDRFVNRNNDDSDDEDEKQNNDEQRPTLGTGGSVTTAQWVATDYQQGDIKAGSYTIKSGDTLWEIAEAVYGNGAEWTRILNANASLIGRLPNGQQALIFPGQVLNIPQ